MRLGFSISVVQVATKTPEPVVPSIHTIIFERDFSTEPLASGTYIAIPLDGTYKEISIQGSNISSDISSRISTDGGSTYLDASTSYWHSFRNSTTGTFMKKESNNLRAILEGNNATGVWYGFGGNGKTFTRTNTGGGSANPFLDAGAYDGTDATHLGIYSFSGATSGYVRVLGIT